MPRRQQTGPIHALARAAVALTQAVAAAFARADAAVSVAKRRGATGQMAAPWLA